MPAYSLRFLLGLLILAGLAERAPAQEVALDLAFMTHLDMDLPEQDVFIERVPGSGEVFRVTPGDHDMRAPLYATAEEVPHNPFDPAAVGPHPTGAPLGMTLGEWLRHAGTGTYRCEGGVGTLDLAFSGLVPDGVYTMWHAFMALPPPVPFTGTLDLPLGARDGSESVFTADADGRARFRHTFQPCLQMSDTWTTSMLAINYHSDGKTYGGHPGPFGRAAHIPLFVMLPLRDGIDPTETASTE
ncbi:MAG: hypothetical protein R3362_04665 [Rhodothermales bacterium]|nr:hypothetical protein [Rhodothermales bacterium]